MEWIDYREKLGLGFNDTEKANRCMNYLLTHLSAYFNELEFENGAFKLSQSKSINKEEYLMFCSIIGERYQNTEYIYSAIIHELEFYQRDFKEFISVYIALVNSVKNRPEGAKQKDLLAILDKSFNESRLQYCILKDGDQFFVFPKGAKELDNKLVSEPLEWLKNFPQTYKIYAHTLKQYSNNEVPRDVADNLRKSLETFLQEFFNNEKNLDNNIHEVGRFFDSKCINRELKAIFTTLLSKYNQANNAVAKHHDKIEENMLEFLLYQTGIFIRTLISLKVE